MKMEFVLTDEIAAEMKKYPNMNWNNIVNQAIQGCLQDFSILDKLKEFWGIERKKTE